MSKSSPKRNYDHESKDNEERKYAYDFDFKFRHYMIRTFEPFLPPGKALELGCHLGEFTEILTKHYHDITVIEASGELLNATSMRVNNKVRFIHNTFEKWKTHEHFDAIFLLHTLEHLDDPVLVLKKINQWLSPKGLLFLAVPNANAPSRQLAVKMGLITHNTAVTEGEFKQGHRCTYTFDTLEHDARTAGLNIIHRGGIFFKPLANFQWDKILKTDIINENYLEACYQFGMQHPELCASIYLICTTTET